MLSTSSALNKSYNFGVVQLSPETVLLSLGVLFLGWFADKLTDMIITRSMERKDSGKHAIKVTQRLSSYLVYSIVLIAVLGIFGIPLTALGTMVGLIGLGISFALKDMIANFFSGLMIMINRPFKIGDQITVNGESGTVKDIRIRATDIKTFDGRKVVVPNSNLYNGTVINNTAYNLRRFEVIVGIGYDDDIEKAKDAAMEILKESNSIEDDPEPQVLVNDLGGSSVNLKLRAWTSPSRADMVKASSEITQNVKEKFDEEGIEIPYPIRTVFMNNQE